MFTKIKLLLTTLSFLILANFCWSWRLYQKTTSIHTQLDLLETQLNHSTSNLTELTWRFGENLSTQIKTHDSLLVQSELNLAYKDNLLDITCSFTPKVLGPKEKVYVTIGEKVEATSTNGIIYTAHLIVPFTETISPVVSFESENGIQCETLDETSIKDFFSLKFYAEWKTTQTLSPTDENTLEITLFITRNNRWLLEGKNKAELIIIDEETNLEVNRLQLDFKPSAASNSKHIRQITHSADLTPYINQLGSYRLELDFITHNNLYYTDQIANFSNSKDTHSQSSMSSTLIPIW